MGIKKEITIGECRLILGDCLEVLPLLGKVDMVLVDMPYGTTACKWDTVLPLDKIWESLNSVVKPNGAIVMTAAQPFTTTLIASNMDMFKYCWTWEKNKSTGFLNAKKQPLRATEDLVVFYKNQATYNPQKTTGHKPVNSFTKNTSDGETLGKTLLGVKGGGQTDRYPKNILKTSVVNNDNSNGDKLHPTQKPVELMEYLIKTYTEKGDTVLDFTMGSGTTMVACDNLGRKGIGVELDENYFNIAVKRLQDNQL